MPNLTNQESLHLYQIDFACTMPKLTAENVDIDFYGVVRGKGANYRFGGGLPGRTLKVTDAQSTTTTEKTCTFKRSDFADPEQASLAEIVVAIEAAFHEAAHVTPSSGAYGELILTSGAANVAGVCSIGKGTANEMLGFPVNGLSVDQATGITITLPPEMNYPDNTYMYYFVPRVKLYALTVATGVLTELFGPVGLAAPVFTPSARTLFLENGSVDAAGVVRGVVTL